MGVRGDVIAQLDWTMGEVMKALRNLGLDKNTIVIFSSDNGPVVNDGYKDRSAELLHGHSPAGPLRGNKYSAFEGGTHVPAIVWWPGHVEKGATSQALVSQIDLMASLGQLINARLPKGAAPDSFKAWDSWTGKDSLGRQWVVEEAANHTLSLRTKKWKYISPCANPYKIMQNEQIETGYDDKPQLYNVAEDIHEDNNLAAEVPEETSRLKDLLDTIIGIKH